MVTNLEALKVTIQIDKGCELLTLSCTLPDLANICLQSSTVAIFYPVLQGDLRKARDDSVEEQSVVLIWKPGVCGTKTRLSVNVYNLVVGNIVCGFHSNALCQPMSWGLNTRSKYLSNLQRFESRFSKAQFFGKMVIAIFQSNIGNSYKIGTQWKNDGLSNDSLCKDCDNKFRGCSLLLPFLWGSWRSSGFYWWSES